MPAKKKKTVTTKLIGFAVVTAVVVLGVKNQIPIGDQQTYLQIQGSPLPVVAIPVDRQPLSQQILPSLPALGSTETHDTLDLDPSKSFAMDGQADQAVASIGPSLYKLKLEDQKAWGSRPLRASLASATTQSVGASKKISAAVSQSPIVPGHEDPHLGYESQFFDFDIAVDDQQNQEPAKNDLIEFKELPKLFHESPHWEPLPPKALPTGPAPVSAAPISVTPISATPISVTPISVTPISVTPMSTSAMRPASAKPISAPATSAGHAWETGRY